MNARKKFIIGCLLAVLPLSATFARKGHHHHLEKAKPADSTKTIHWMAGKEPDFEDSVRKDKKPAFLYIYIDGWEDVAKFNQNVLADTNIVNFVDSNFMAYKVNMYYDSPNAIKFMIDKVPAIILLDNKGGEMANLQGYHDAKEFKKFLKKGLKK